MVLSSINPYSNKSSCGSECLEDSGSDEYKSLEFTQQFFVVYFLLYNYFYCIGSFDLYIYLELKRAILIFLWRGESMK